MPPQRVRSAPLGTARYQTLPHRRQNSHAPAVGQSGAYVANGHWAEGREMRGANAAAYSSSASLRLLCSASRSHWVAILNRVSRSTLSSVPVASFRHSAALFR